jgi:hypothetical protein
LINGQDAALLKDEMVSPLRKLNGGDSPKPDLSNMIDGRTPLRKSQIMNQQYDKITEEEGSSFKSPQPSSYVNGH